MCAPKTPKIETPVVAKPIPASEETATSYRRDNGSKKLTGDAAKARRSLSDLRVDLTPPTTGLTGLQVS